MNGFLPLTTKIF